LHSADLKDGIWVRAIAEAGGENDRAKALYIKLRVAQLIEEEKSAEEMKFAEEQRLAKERQEQAEMQKRTRKERELNSKLDAAPVRCQSCGAAISPLSEICGKCGRLTF